MTILYKPLVVIDKPSPISGRLFCKETIDQLVEDVNSKDLKVLGELDVSQNGAINTKRVSHMINELYIENDMLMAKIKVLETPMGEILQQLLDVGVEVDLCMRGVGTLSEDNEVTEFKFITADVIANHGDPLLSMVYQAGPIDPLVFRSLREDGLL